MSKCSTGCSTQNHASFGECMRSKRVKPTWIAESKGLSKTAEKNWDGELDAYRDARRQGIQPDTTRMADVVKAVEISNQTGEAYQA